MEKEGTFLVTHADADAAVLRDVADSQVHTLAENEVDTEGEGDRLREGEVVVGTVAPEPPLEVAWRLVSVDSRRTVAVERSDEAPTAQARELAADHDVGEVARRERAGEGELHVLPVPPGEAGAAADEVVADEATLVRAARLGVSRVEVRADEDADLVSVRYLP